MSEDSRLARLKAYGFTPEQMPKVKDMADKLVNDYKYRVEFLKNPKSFVEAEAGIHVDDKLMVTVWNSVSRLTDQDGQPLEGQLQEINLD